MIRHILNIIWKDRKLNAWILLELIIVFCVFWFCSEYLYIAGKHYFEPAGFDLNHTYLIDFETKKINEETTREQTYEYTMTILDRIKKNSMIESACLSGKSHPYSGQTNGMLNVIANGTDTLMKKGNAYIYNVSPEYFDVFKIKIDRGRAFDWDPTGIKHQAMISPDDNNMLYEAKSADELRTIKRTFYGTDISFIPDGEELTITGVTNKMKFLQYEPYPNIFFTPIDKNRIDPVYNICVRVKPDADKDFIRKFNEEMESQLEIGPYFLSAITPLNDLKDLALKKYSRYENNVKSVSSIGLFLLVNIFLGVIGTFWFRTQSRRSEIGLRMALGSSRQSVRNILIAETLLILFLASIIGTVICLNLSLTDLLKVIGMPSMNKEFYGIDTGQYIINYCITFVVLALISIMAVWYPASKASKVQPALVLKDE